MERYSNEKRDFKTNGKDLVLIRFAIKRESFIWVNPEAILFIKSADHYIKTLVQHENKKTWVIRHSTIKEISLLLNGNNFIRLNKFYVINKIYVSHIDECAKIVYLKDGFPISLTHRVSPFILGMF